MAEVFVHKVTLSSGKVILLREPKIKDQDLAMQAAAGKSSSSNQLQVASLMQQEFIKILLEKVGDKVPSASERENLDGLFSYREYMEVGNALGQILGTGDNNMGNFRMELVKHGG